MQNTRVTRILHLYLSIIVSFLGFSWKTKAKIKRRMITKQMKESILKPWSLLLNLNGYTHELIDP
jgi:hypothetical protein